MGKSKGGDAPSKAELMDKELAKPLIVIKRTNQDREF